MIAHAPMKQIKSAAIGVLCAATLLLGSALAALAAGTQTATISTTTFTDLGAAPIQAQTLSSPVTIIVSDSQPSVAAAGSILSPGLTVTYPAADAGSHVWAAKLGSTTLVAYTPSPSSGGGGGGSVTQGTSPWVDSITTWGGGTLGTMANYGTSPGAVLVPGVNAFVTNFPSAFQANAGTNLNTSLLALEAGGNLAAVATNTGPPGATACGTDTGSCSLNALAQRLAQRLTSILTALNAPMQQTGGTVGLVAGQASLGNVGSITKTVCVTPTTTSATYAANVDIGGLLTFSSLFTSTGHGHIQTVALNFNTAQTVGFKLYPFRTNLPNTTVTDHSAVTLSSASSNADIFAEDQPIQLTNPDSGLGTQTNYGAIGLGQDYNPAGTSGFFILVPTATTATLGGTANTVQVCVTVQQDA